MPDDELNTVAELMLRVSWTYLLNPRGGLDVTDEVAVRELRPALPRPPRPLTPGARALPLVVEARAAGPLTFPVVEERAPASVSKPPDQVVSRRAWRPSSTTEEGRPSSTTEGLQADQLVGHSRGDRDGERLGAVLGELGYDAVHDAGLDERGSADAL